MAGEGVLDRDRITAYPSGTEVKAGRDYSRQEQANSVARGISLLRGSQVLKSKTESLRSC